MEISTNRLGRHDSDSIMINSKDPPSIWRDNSSMSKIRRRFGGINDNCPGFSLIEVMVVLALMSALALFLGSKINNIDTDLCFDKTCHMMEEIKEAIIGKQGFYCNGIRQFTGYVSDMGTMPGLFYVDQGGNSEEFDKGDDISEILKRCDYPPQPKALWTRNINEDEKNKIPEEVLWKYHEHSKIWAGWRGPYITPPEGRVLRDAWGNPFVFIIGELVTHNINTYLCVKSHEASYYEPHTPGDGSDYWKELSAPINSRKWIHPGSDQGQYAIYEPHASGCPTKRDFFYDDAFTIISFGKNGKPGGEGVNKDLVLAIYPEEYTGEVAGHIGYSGKPYVGKLELYYPKYTEQGGRVESVKIASIRDNDNGYGIHFRFGTACESNDPCVEEFDCNCDYASHVNFQKVAIPMGIRSIKAGGKNFIFAVTEGGNWMGTLK